MASTVLDLGYVTQDIRITKGDDITFTMSFVDKSTGIAKNLTGYTFNAGMINPTVTFTVTNLVPTTGVITVSISGASLYGNTIGEKYVWSLSYALSGKTKTVMKGKAEVV